MHERRARTRVGQEAGVVALVLLGLLALLSVAVLTGGARGVDEAFTPAPDPLTHRLAQVVELIARPSVSIALGILLTALLVWWGRRQAALLVLLTVGAAGLLGAMLKLLISRERPAGAEVGALDLPAAFPSGHMTMATALFFAVAFAATEPGSAARRTALVLATVLALLVGVGRVTGGAHFPSDVLGGLLLGAAVACFADWLLSTRWVISPPFLTRWLGGAR